MKIIFSKVEGAGNDFVIIDDRDEKIKSHIDYSSLAEKVCDRHFGIGGDGLMVVNNSDTHDIRFRIFNPDGSEPEMCGNGIRCYAKFVYDNDIITKEQFEVETLAGTIIPKVNPDENGIVNTVRVDMGQPILDPKKVPFISKDSDKNGVSEKISAGDKEFEITVVSMGNPHGVIFVDKITDEHIFEYGPILEKHQRFPEKANIEFIEVLSRNEMNMRVWERGAGETLACGTGASASLVAAVLNDKADRKAKIHLLGGDLTIEWDKETNKIFKTGPATLVFEGTIKV
ncbi:MAG: diaminopimelate epimerase [Fusobacteriota bacterium]